MGSARASTRTMIREHATAAEALSWSKMLTRDSSQVGMDGQCLASAACLEALNPPSLLSPFIMEINDERRAQRFRAHESSVGGISPGAHGKTLPLIVMVGTRNPSSVFGLAYQQASSSDADIPSSTPTEVTVTAMRLDSACAPKVRRLNGSSTRCVPVEQRRSLHTVRVVCAT